MAGTKRSSAFLTETGDHRQVPSLRPSAAHITEDGALAEAKQTNAPRMASTPTLLMQAIDKTQVAFARSKLQDRPEVVLSVASDFSVLSSGSIVCEMKTWPNPPALPSVDTVTLKETPICTCGALQRASSAARAQKRDPKTTYSVLCCHIRFVAEIIFGVDVCSHPLFVALPGQRGTFPFCFSAAELAFFRGRATAPDTKHSFLVDVSWFTPPRERQQYNPPARSLDENPIASPTARAPRVVSALSNGMSVNGSSWVPQARYAFRIT